MQRHLINDLVTWKSDPNRKPLILQGARQVGKTWIMTRFGQTEFKQVVYINFESSVRLQNLFQEDFNIERIILALEIETNQKIIPDNTLIIFDEIQEVEKGLTALKYFYELAPNYYIIAAGSLLGVSLQKNNSFPVGKVDFLRLNPMSFIEFIENLGHQNLSEQISKKNWSVLNLFHEQLVSLLRLYYFVGGMPEVVASFLENNDLGIVRSIQKKILSGYENDFAKYAPNHAVPRIRLVWNSVLSQLTKENKKFVYGQLKKGARAKDFELSIQWLVDAGLILKVNRIEKPNLPLSAYEDFEAYKLFFLDIGLMNAQADLDQQIVLEKNRILIEFKGALTEQYVAQQLVQHNKLYYWSSLNNAEVDFVIQKQNLIIPIEVKAEENLKSKSLKFFVQKFAINHAIRTSMSNFRENDWLTNVPLYAIWHLH